MKKRPLDTMVKRREKMKNQKFFKTQLKRQVDIRKYMVIRIKKGITFKGSHSKDHRSFK